MNNEDDFTALPFDMGTKWLLTALLWFLYCGTHIVKSAEQEWWQNAVIYQIYPRSLKDSNNDGIGDLRGIQQSLDYLAETGVNAIWLSPIYKSPQVDMGYDISDYKQIAEIFGSLYDFKDLVANAHLKGIKIILDYVPNHTSNMHDWFIKSERREPGYENYYMWLDGESEGKPPNNWKSIFDGPAWTYNEIREQWYFHNFAAGQPDLNYREPKVVQAMKDVLTFWLDHGVDGFRVDIISVLFEDENFPSGPLDSYFYRINQPENYDMVYQWRQLLDDYQQEHGGEARIMMTESYTIEPVLDKIFLYYGNGTHKGAHFPFNFKFTVLKESSNAKDFKREIELWVNEMPQNSTANWLLGNHDVNRTASRYDPKRIDALNMLSLLLPGVTITYYGEEIGMVNGWVSWEDGEDVQGCQNGEENWTRRTRDFARTPFQWDNTTNSGFNVGHKPWLPVADNYKQLNLANQKEVEGLKSHYRIYGELVKIKKTDTIKYGSLQVESLQNDNVLVFVRRLDNNPTIVVLMNFRSENVKGVNLTILEDISDSMFIKVSSLQSNRSAGDQIGIDAIDLDPYEALVLSSGQKNFKSKLFCTVILSLLIFIRLDI